MALFSKNNFSFRDTWLPENWPEVWDLHAADRAALADRTRRLAQLVGREQITSDDILHADFGTTNPRGLDIRPRPTNTPVHIRFMDDESYLADHGRETQSIAEKFLGGSAEPLRDTPIININPSKRDDDSRGLSENFWDASAVAHEHAHVLQGQQQKNIHASTLTQNTVLSGFAEDSRRERSGFWDRAEKLRITFNHAAHNLRSFMPPSLSAAISKDFWTDAALNFQRHKGNTIQNYYGTDAEIQARMHQIMAGGHAIWGRMPATKTELWAAMHNVGIRTPDHVMNALENTPEGQQALHDFPHRPTLTENVKDTVYDINLVYGYAGAAGPRARLWDRELPGLYGNLLELYGDSQGRARMDLGPPRQPMLDLFYAINTASGNEDPAQAETLRARVEDAANAIPPELAHETATALCQTLAQPDRQKTDYNLLALNALLLRPEMRDKIINTPNASAGMGVTGPAYTPITMAIYVGNAAAAEALINAGETLHTEFEARLHAAAPGKIQSPIATIQKMADHQSTHRDDDAPPERRAFHADIRETLRTIGLAAQRNGTLDAPQTVEGQTVTLRQALGAFAPESTAMPGQTAENRVSARQETRPGQ